MQWRSCLGRRSMEGKSNWLRRPGKSELLFLAVCSCLNCIINAVNIICNTVNILLKKLMLFFTKDALNWSEVTVNIYNVTKDATYKFCLFELSTHRKRKPKTKSCSTIGVNHKTQVLPELQISILKWFLKDHVTLTTYLLGYLALHYNKLF